MIRTNRKEWPVQADARVVSETFVRDKLFADVHVEKISNDSVTVRLNGKYFILRAGDTFTIDFDLNA